MTRDARRDARPACYALAAAAHARRRAYHLALAREHEKREKRARR